jgi:hypothetical protein
MDSFGLFLKQICDMKWIGILSFREIGMAVMKSPFVHASDAIPYLLFCFLVRLRAARRRWIVS